MHCSNPNPHQPPTHRASTLFADHEPVATLYDCDNGTYRGTVTLFQTRAHSVSVRLVGGGAVSDDADIVALGGAVRESDADDAGEPVAMAGGGAWVVSIEKLHFCVGFGFLFFVFSWV
jgi:hypothetical protein